MYKKMVPIILLSVIALQNFLSALPQEDLFQITFLPKEIGSHEKIAVHPNGQSIIYTVHQKPLEGFPDDAYIMPTGVPFNRLHSYLYIYELESGKTTQIGPKDANCWRPCFSPDGQKIAFYCDKEGFSNLWIHDIASAQSSLACKNAIRTNLFGLVDRPYWSPDSSLVYIPILPLEHAGTLSDSNQKNQETTVCLYSSESPPSQLNIPVFGKISSVNLRTGECNIIAPINENDPLSFQFALSKTGLYVAYLSFLNDVSTNPCDLRVCSVDSKKTFNITKHLTIRGKTAEIVWHPHQDKLAFIEKGRVFIASWDKNGEYELKELSKGYEAIFSTTTLRFSPDGKTLLVGTNTTDLGHSEYSQTLFLFSLEGASPHQIIIPKGWSYHSTLETEGGDFWQPEKDVVVISLINSTENAIVKFYFETNCYEILWKSQSNVKGMIASKETNQVFYINENLNTSQNIYRASFDFSIVARLTHIDPLQDFLEEITAIVIESTVPRYDGTLEKVDTTILLPKGIQPNQQLPAIVEVYPGANLQSAVKRFGGGNIASFPSRLLLEQGYAIVLPDLRIRPEGESGNPIQETVDRLLPQIYQASCLGLIDINRLGLIGQSFGGYGAAGIVTKTNLFRASVSISGIYDLTGAYGIFSKNWEGFADTDWYENRQGRMGTHPWENMFRYLENSPYYLAKDIYTPLLLIHGEKDITFEVQEAQKMFTALKRLGKKVNLAVYKKEGHVINNWNHSNAIDAVKRIIAFYDHHLLPKDKKPDEKRLVASTDTISNR
ncbi:S9 family peptidase [Parachlamydia acanthamoebae]|nr:prolyl oligopeptidase family serine peptidase [Parachlamydia acanthamoebae]